MQLGIILIEALVVGAVASAVAHLILGAWAVRSFVAWWLALALIAWVALAGPIKLG